MIPDIKEYLSGGHIVVRLFHNNGRNMNPWGICGGNILPESIISPASANFRLGSCGQKQKDDWEHQAS